MKWIDVQEANGWFSWRKYDGKRKRGAFSYLPILCGKAMWEHASRNKGEQLMVSK